MCIYKGLPAVTKGPENMQHTLNHSTYYEGTLLVRST